MDRNWDPKAMLSNLSFLEQKIHQVQDIVRSIASQQGQFSNRANELAAHQQLVTADLTNIIIQLISTAGTLLPSTSSDPPSSSLEIKKKNIEQKEAAIIEDNKISEYENMIKELNDSGECFSNFEAAKLESNRSGGHHIKESEDDNLPPGAYEVLQLEKEEILVPHTHFCTICGKGFKRDANLRMHMRGHGDKYKTPAALAKPIKESGSTSVIMKRYSCPFVGCKRNKEHKKFQPLKTILCVKNHYKRSHCDKSYTCSRCKTKKFSVIADLKTHEKHCGRDKWLCSCGTTFSRKDKLFGHVSLFQGHKPAISTDGAIQVSTAVHDDRGQSSGKGTSWYDVGRNLDMKCVENDRGIFSPLNFDPCNFGAIDDFTRHAFEASENPLSFLQTRTCDVKRSDHSGEL